MLSPNEVYQEAFQKNWQDWLKGGPSESGWTRTGDPIVETPLKIGYQELYSVKVQSVLAKNQAEVTRWHLGLILAHLQGEDLTQTFYWKEYLLPRMDEEKALVRVQEFVTLFDTFDIDKCPPVWLANVSRLKLGFDYFRFDGCHRACCALSKGYNYVPALVFSTHDVLL